MSISLGETKIRCFLGEYEVSGSAPESIVKTVEYTGSGSTTVTVTFPEKPAFIVGIHGTSASYEWVTNHSGFVWGAKRSGNAWLDNPSYIMQYFNGETNIMSYGDFTMTIEGTDNGAACNESGVKYVVYYIPESAIDVKTVTYTGDGTTSNTISFSETPELVLGITSDETDDYTTAIRSFDPFVWGSPVGANLFAARSDGQSARRQRANNITYSGDQCTIAGADTTNAMNKSGVKYTVYYIAASAHVLKSETISHKNDYVGVLNGCYHRCSCYVSATEASSISPGMMTTFYARYSGYTQVYNDAMIPTILSDKLYRGCRLNYKFNNGETYTLYYID